MRGNTKTVLKKIMGEVSIIKLLPFQRLIAITDVLLLCYAWRVNSYILWPNLQTHIEPKVEEEFKDFKGSLFNGRSKYFNGFLVVSFFF